MSTSGRNCTEIALALTVFAGSSHVDLPDDIAQHLESCPRCLATFNRLFPPLLLCSSTRPTPRAEPQPRAAAALLALGLVAIGLSVPQPEADPVVMMLHGESPLTVEEMLALDPECPLLAAETDPPVCAEDDGEWM